MKLASWNVNSLKIRQDQVISFFKENDIDILALQETKILDENFPLTAFQDLGLYVAFTGQKSYNGVAVLSRTPIENIMIDIPDLVDPSRRILAVNIGELRLINLYVPNGSHVGSEKYEYKLKWLESIKAFLKIQLEEYPNIAVVGDFNIAPSDLDVYDPIGWEGSVLVSDLERQMFNELCTLGLFDAYRYLYPSDTAYTWWDYRMGRFRRNHGLRIDHILLNQKLLPILKEVKVDVIPRRSERPSDHAPIWALLDLI